MKIACWKLTASENFVLFEVLLFNQCRTSSLVFLLHISRKIQKLWKRIIVKGMIFFSFTFLRVELYSRMISISLLGAEYLKTGNIDKNKVKISYILIYFTSVSVWKSCNQYFRTFSSIVDCSISAQTALAIVEDF